METKHKIHAFYILSILIITIILLISVKWSEIPRLVEYITFALTMTSLTLAVLAIVYSIYSNSIFSQNVADLNQSTNRIVHVASSLSETTTALFRRVEEIPPLIEGVGKKVDSLAPEIFQQPASVPSTPSATGIEVDQVLPRSSLAALYILYGCSLAHKKRIPFDYRKFTETALDGNHSFAWGIITAYAAAGIMTIHTGADALLFIDEFNTTLQEELPVAIDKEIETRKAKAENHAQFLSELKAAVEGFFERAGSS